MTNLTYHKVCMTPDELVAFRAKHTLGEWSDMIRYRDKLDMWLAPVGGVGQWAVAANHNDIIYEACCDYRRKQAGRSLFGDGDAVTFSLQEMVVAHA